MIVLRIILWIIVLAAVVGVTAVIADIGKIRQKGIYARFIKRFLDAFLSTGALIVFSPLLFILIIVGMVKMKGNPFFTQDRPGWNEKIFKLIKFRTMTNERGVDGELLPDEDRLIPYGKMLRSTSLDELPELINIVKGERDIIGTTKKNLDFMRFSAA